MPSNTSPPTRSQPVHILLAEDDGAFVYLLRKALRHSGLEFELTAIDDGELALAFVRGEGHYVARRMPDLAVIDVKLPKCNGLEVLEAISRDQEFANVAVVVMSAHSDPPQSLATDRFAFARYIPKPTDLDELMQVGRLLRKMALERRLRLDAAQQSDRPALEFGDSAP